MLVLNNNNEGRQSANLDNVLSTNEMNEYNWGQLSTAEYKLNTTEYNWVQQNTTEYNWVQLSTTTDQSLLKNDPVTVMVWVVGIDIVNVSGRSWSQAVTNMKVPLLNWWESKY